MWDIKELLYILMLGQCLTTVLVIVVIALIPVGVRRGKD